MCMRDKFRHIGALIVILSTLWFVPTRSQDPKDAFWGNLDFIPGEALSPHGLHHEDPEKFTENFEDYLKFMESKKEEIWKILMYFTVGIVLLLIYIIMVMWLIVVTVKLNKEASRRSREYQRGKSLIELEDYAQVVKKHGVKEIENFLLVLEKDKEKKKKQAKILNIQLKKSSNYQE
uniref:Uncharacterized protein n=1 Tax=Lepeophtheirus salmonis TaxID=72036 RepID=A0A0K2TZR2_LEPSM